ncbi:hypothetical protein ACQKWADRAFT_305691 [Trichoderma austrokoningii]
MSELDADINQAYEDVRADKLDTNWMLLSYADDDSKKLVLAQTGTGGLSEFVKVLGPEEALSKDRVHYGYVRIEYANDKESTRIKFVLIIWIGKDVKMIRRRRILEDRSKVESVLNMCHLTVTADDVSELDQDALVTLLRKSGGADYNGGRG